MAINQAYLFLIFALNGFVIGLLFDFFRILRKSFKTTDIITYLEDILFWILAGFTVLYSIFVFNNGEIRIYMFLAILIGVILYMLILSSYIIKINVYIIDKIKFYTKSVLNIILIPFKFIFKILKKILFKPISFIFINFKNSMKSIKDIFQKMTINSKKTINNIKQFKNN